MPDGQFYGAIIWYHLMAPFYGMCVPGIILRWPVGTTVHKSFNYLWARDTKSGPEKVSLGQT